MPKLTIKRKDVKKVNTKYGEKEKHNFLLESDKGEFWAGCFANAVTEAWKEGDVVDMVLKSREYQGKTYWDIIPPKPMDLILESLKRIEAKLGIAEEPQDDFVDDVPPPDEDDIPF